MARNLVFSIFLIANLFAAEAEKAPPSPKTKIDSEKCSADKDGKNSKCGADDTTRQLDSLKLRLWDNQLPNDNYPRLLNPDQGKADQKSEP